MSANSNSFHYKEKYSEKQKNNYELRQSSVKVENDVRDQLIVIEPIGDSFHNITPPRYQPPPQPTGGILKKITIKNSATHNYFKKDSKTAHNHQNYLPEVTKQVCIPDNKKSQVIISEIEPSGYFSRNTSLPKQNRMLNEDEQSKGLQHHQEMLKFVRKQKCSSPTHNASFSTSSTRITSEQNLNIQVSFSFCIMYMCEFLFHVQCICDNL